MVGENTHIAGLRGEVDLDDILGLVDGLQWRVRQLARARSIGVGGGGVLARGIACRVIVIVPGEGATGSA